MEQNKNHSQSYLLEDIFEYFVCIGVIVKFVIFMQK